MGLMMMDRFCSVPEAVEDLKRGRMVVLIDDPDRENEGDLAMLAEFATPEAISFMATQGRGLICLPLPGGDCDRLGLELQPRRHSNAFGTGFTISIDAADATGPGISAHARAHTIRRPIPTPRRWTSAGRVMSSRYARKTVAFSSAQDTQKRFWILRDSPAHAQPV